MKNELHSAFGNGNAHATTDESNLTIASRAALFNRYLKFSTPGHKGALSLADVSEYDGDSLFPGNSITLAERAIALRYGVKKARLLTGGSSMAVKAAILAADCDFVAPKFSHRCVQEGVSLAKRNLHFFPTPTKLGLPQPPTVSDYRAAFAAHPEAQGAIVTSPDYFGRTAPVRDIAEFCKKSGKLLLCDCAHGAHFASRRDLFPDGGEKYGDFTNMSAHKTLRAFTQTAIGVVNNPDYFDKYDAALDLLGTSSPSYLLLASVQDALAFEDENASGYDALVSAAHRIREKLDCAPSDDPLRLTVRTKGYSGRDLYHAAYEKGVLAEAYYGEWCVFIITLSDSTEKVDALQKTLCSLSQK